MCAPSPPPAPDYTGAARAQGAANVEAARTTGKLSNPNVFSPYGTQTVTYGGFNQAGFDAAQKAYQDALAQWSTSGGRQATTTFDPNTGQPVQSFIPLPQPIPPNREQFGTGDPDQPTLTQKFSPEQQALYEQQLKVKGLLGGLGQQGATALQGVVGKNLDFSGQPTAPGSYADTRKQVIDAAMARVDEDTNRMKDQRHSDLIAAGIRPGTKAYDDQMALIERGHTDARQQAILQAGAEESRAFGMDAERRRQAITELLAQRQVPLNEITALMSGSQVQNPFAVPNYAPNAQVAPPPIFGATQLAGQYGTDIYNAQAAQAANLQSGLFGLGAAGAYGLAARSDRRLKRHIQRIGTHHLGIGIYEYDIEDRHEIGVMADEVLTVKPSAVLIHPDGYLMVDYAQL